MFTLTATIFHLRPDIYQKCCFDIFFSKHFMAKTYKCFFSQFTEKTIINSKRINMVNSSSGKGNMAHRRILEYSIYISIPQRNFMSPIFKMLPKTLQFTFNVFPNKQVWAYSHFTSILQNNIFVHKSNIFAFSVFSGYARIGPSLYKKTKYIRNVSLEFVD